MVVMTVYGDRLDSLSYTYFDELSAADVAHLRAVAVDVSERFRELQGRGPVLE